MEERNKIKTADRKLRWKPDCQIKFIKPGQEVIKDQKLDPDCDMSEQAERPVLIFSIVETRQLLAEMNTVIKQSRKLLHQSRIEGEQSSERKPGSISPSHARAS